MTKNAFKLLLCAMSVTALTAANPVMASEAELAQEIKDLREELRALKQQLAAKPQAETSAPAAASKPVPRVVESSAHKFSLESADGQHSIAVTGIVQADFGGYLNFTPRSTAVGAQHITSGINTRRGRIGVTGKVFGDWSYAFIYDAGNSQDTTPKGIQSAQLSYNGFKGVIIDLPGYSSTPFTLEQATSAADIMFLERATPTNLAIGLNAGDTRTNTGVRFFGDRYWVGAYFTGPASNDSHTGLHERFGAFQRATYRVLVEKDYSLHIGAGIDELLQAPNSGPGTAKTLTLSDTPELRLDPTSLLTTGALGTVANPVTGGMVYAVEAAGTWRGLYAQGEYFIHHISRRGLQAAEFQSGYAQVSYTLTGETRGYNNAVGAYRGIVPSKPFSLKGGGWGAWEVAARFSYADLTDNFVAGTALAAQPSAVNGGKQRGYTLGLNWYPNSLMRVMVNYIHTDFTKANGTAVTGAALGAPVGAKADALAARLQFSY
jgi:phosphate-selective porin OprO/OprP